MSTVLTQTGAEYAPKYLFVSGDHQRGTGKSRHVMKEFLRKRDSIRRQHQLAARSKSRVLPWLRREDMESTSTQTNVAPGDSMIMSEVSSDSSSSPPSPQQSQWTAGSTMEESFSSPAFSSSTSAVDNGTPPDNSIISSQTRKSLTDYVHTSVIGRLYQTKESSNSMSPASAMANHIMTHRVASRILLAIGSLNRDIEAGHRTPSSATLALVVEGIGLLHQRFQNTQDVSDDAIMTVINLWVYEVMVSMGFASEDQVDHNTLTNNIQTHLKGLQRLIEVRGGLEHLSPETLWLLAWCVSTQPGYSPIDTRMMKPSSSLEPQSQLRIDGYYCLPRLFDTLANIQRHMSSPDSQSSILDEPVFSPLKRALLRMSALRMSFSDHKSPMGRIRKSAALTSTLLFIFDVLLGSTGRAHEEGRVRRNELLKAQQRLVDHHLDREGSCEKAWAVTMTQQEAPELRLHARAWSVVEMVNVLKQLDVSTIDSLSQLLLGYLLPEIRDHHVGDYRYERLIVQIHFELDGLADLG